MKIIILLFVYIWSPVLVAFSSYICKDHQKPHGIAVANKCSSLMTRIDSVYEYSWLKNAEEWVPTGFRMYSYKEGYSFPEETLYQTFSPRINVTKVQATFGPGVLIDGHVVLSWLEPDGWKNIQWFDYTYDEEGHRILGQKYIYTDKWVENERYYYTTAQDGRLIYYTRYFRKSDGEWYQFSEHFITFDNEGRILLRQEFRLEDQKEIWRLTYHYDDHGILSFLTDENWSGPSLVHSITKTTYEYDELGLLHSDVLFSWDGTKWNRMRKNVYFRNITFKMKVPVCHNDQTIYVSKNAVKAHFAHGDCIGECIYEKPDGKYKSEYTHNTDDKQMFTIYPNPAREMVKIKFSGFDSEIKRVEFTDFQGKLLKTINVKGNYEISINCDGLMNGIYIIRIIGNEVYQAVVIFE